MFVNGKRVLAGMLLLTSLLFTAHADEENDRGYIATGPSQWQMHALLAHDDAQTLVDDLAKAAAWPALQLRGVSVQDAVAVVDFAQGSYPVYSAELDEEPLVLLSIARTLLDNLPELQAVSFSIEGNPYQNGTILMEIGEAYLTREQLERMERMENAYNSNRPDGEYVDPEAPVPADAPADELPHVGYSDYDLSDEGVLYQLAHDAAGLLNIACDTYAAAPLSFTGKPEPEYAWRMMEQFLRWGRKRSAELVPEATLAQPQQEIALPASAVTRIYDALFAYGRVPATPGEGIETAFVRQGAEYLYRALEGQEIEGLINAVSAGEDGSICVDVSAVRRGEGSASQHLFNGTISLLPDPSAIFGAKIVGMTSDEVRPSFAWVRQIALDGNQNASALIDGQSETDFAVMGEPLTATLRMASAVPQKARGICLLPGNAEAYADTARIASLCVTLSDGNVFEVDFEDMDGADWVCVPFESIHQVEWIELQILALYSGDVSDDLILSEIRVF